MGDLERYFESHSNHMHPHRTILQATMVLRLVYNGDVQNEEEGEEETCVCIVGQPGHRPLMLMMLMCRLHLRDT